MPNQYIQVGGTSRAHDGNGNLTEDGTYLFGYDFQNRLVELKSKSTRAVIADYRYDALGRRVEKTINGGAVTRYILDGVQVVEEYDGSDNWAASYVYEDGIDQPRSMDQADISDVNPSACDVLLKMVTTEERRKALLPGRCPSPRTPPLWGPTIPDRRRC